MPQGKLLIVDDKKSVLSALQMLLDKHFEKVKAISNPNQIPTELACNKIDIVLLDMNFTAGINSGNEGIYWLSEIKKNRPFDRSGYAHSLWRCGTGRKSLEKRGQ
jgi:two-component system, NtrC family, response regulator HydG